MHVVPDFIKRNKNTQAAAGMPVCCTIGASTIKGDLIQEMRQHTVLVMELCDSDLDQYLVKVMNGAKF